MRIADGSRGPMWTDGLRRLLRIVGKQVEGLDRLDRSTLRRGRRCVGCDEADGERFEAEEGCSEPLGWVCAACDEVLDLVYEKEIEEVRAARQAVHRFLATIAVLVLAAGCAPSQTPHRATMPLAQFDADPWNRCQAHIRDIACAGGPTNLSEDIECIQTLHVEYAHAFDRVAWLEQYDCE